MGLGRRNHGDAGLEAPIDTHSPLFPPIVEPVNPTEPVNPENPDGPDNPDNPASNTPPVISAWNAQLRADEAGVAGDRTDLAALDGSNAVHAGMVTATGSAAASDQDGDALIWQVRGEGGSGASVETAYVQVSIRPDGVYTYTLDAGRSNALVQGETATDSFVPLVSDGRGGTAEELVTVAITGTNDKPALAFASDDGGRLVTSFSQTLDQGRFSVADPDADGALGGMTGGRSNQTFSGTDQDGRQGVPTANGGVSITTAYGMLTIHPDGSYDYALHPDGAVNDLGSHGGATENFVVTVTDVHGSWDSKPRQRRHPQLCRQSQQRAPGEH